MNLFIYTQDQMKLVLFEYDLEVKGRSLYHGNRLLGTYLSQKEAMQVLRQINTLLKQSVHEYCDTEGNIVFAFASTCEIFEMPQAGLDLEND